jgi:hypothetical protein
LLILCRLKLSTRIDAAYNERIIVRPATVCEGKLLRDGRMVSHFHSKLRRIWKERLV